MVFHKYTETGMKSLRKSGFQTALEQSEDPALPSPHSLLTNASWRRVGGTRVLHSQRSSPLPLGSPRWPVPHSPGSPAGGPRAPERSAPGPSARFPPHSPSLHFHICPARGSPSPQYIPFNSPWFLCPVSQAHLFPPSPSILIKNKRPTETNGDTAVSL